MILVGVLIVRGRATMMNRSSLKTCARLRGDASFTNVQLRLLKVAALWFDELFILDPVGASWDTIGADHIARDVVRQLKDAGILEIATPARLSGIREHDLEHGQSVVGDTAAGPANR